MKRALILIVVTVLVTLMMPSRRFVATQTPIGQQWKDETLIAPFDIPIVKPEGLVAEQKASLSNTIKPVFILDTSIISTTYDKLKSHLQDIDTISNEMLDNVLLAWSKVYKNGVISNSEASTYDSKAVLVAIAKDNDLQTYHIGHFYTPNSATKYIEHESGVSSDAFSQYVETNLNYDQTLSAALRTSVLSGVSTTQGLVRSGEVIVTKGQIVDEPTYRTIKSYNIEMTNRLGDAPSLLNVLLGRFIVVFAIFMVNYLFFTRFAVHYFGGQMREMAFVMTLYFLISALVAVVTIAGGMVSIYVVPLPIVSIYLLTFFNMRVAIMGNVTVALLGALFAGSAPFEYFTINALGGFMAIFMMRHFYHRGKLMRALGAIIVTQSILYLSFALMREGSFLTISYASLLWFLVSGLLFLGFYQLIYLVERLFGFVSDVTLLELCDTNQPLLMQLAQNAPGTFQHSVQVANLAEGAAKEIGANPLLARTGALYHDIGKMNNPFHFVENLTGNFNPHDDCTPEQSAKIIKAHVTDGISIARKYKLPASVISFIESHHGESLIFFFYNKAKIEAKNRGTEVIDGDYRYPGPKPVSREASIAMMADAVEAASRSLPSYDIEPLEALVDSVIDTQIRDGQFALSQLTFEEIDRIKSLFKSKLNNIYHGRIAYPARDSK